MAQQVVVKLVDDIDGSEAAETVTFALDGRTYEVDLSEHHAEELRETLSYYIEHGRRLGGATTARRRSSGSSSASSGPKATTDNKAIRIWADENGIPVPSRGRIPRAVVEQWREATGG